MSATFNPSGDPSGFNPNEELDALRMALQASERVVREGGLIDLRDLDEQVEFLCSAVVKTDGELRLQLLPKLEAVIQILDSLEVLLRKNAPPEDLHAQNRLRANQAYGQNTQKGN
jgi:hypothetical protein